MFRKNVLGYISLILIVVLAIGTSACTPSQPTSSDGGEAEKKGLKVALLLNGSANDGGWNQSAYEALKLIESGLGAEVAFTENIAQNDKAQVMREYANKGFNVIIGHGYDYADALTQVAGEYPDAKFIGVVTACTGDNLVSISYKYGEMGYLAGIVAAAYTDSKKIGYVSAIDNPNIQKDVVNLREKIAEVDPAIEVKEAYTGDFNDINKAKEAAVALIDSGCDLLIATCDAGNLGVFQAAEERNVKVIGWVTDQLEMSPDTILTSAVLDLPKLIYAAVERESKGELPGGYFEFGISDGVQYMGTFSSTVSEDIKKEVLDSQQAINDGKITVKEVK